MNEIKPSAILLSFNEFKTLSNLETGKLVLTCKEGSGWITAKDDPNDYFVYEGCVLEFKEGQPAILLQGLSSNLVIEVQRVEC